MRVCVCVYHWMDAMHVLRLNWQHLHTLFTLWCHKMMEVNVCERDWIQMYVCMLFGNRLVVSTKNAKIFGYSICVPAEKLCEQRFRAVNFRAVSPCSASRCEIWRLFNSANVQLKYNARTIRTVAYLPPVCIFSITAWIAHAHYVRSASPHHWKIEKLSMYLIYEHKTHSIRANHNITI